MKFRRRFAALILILAMLLSLMGAISEGAVLTMPAQLVIIDEEAFYGSAAIQKVILPEGIHEIRARAFANSALEEIGLPSSLTFIAEDAFDGSALRTVTAEEGTYAFDWAVKHGYLEYSLGVTVREDGPVPAIGEKLKWMAEGRGGKEPLMYAFKLYRDGTLVSNIPGGVGANFEYVVDAAGEYVLHVIMTDADGNTVETDSAPVTVAGSLALSVSAGAERAKPGDPVTWTAAVTGGTEPFQYAFQLLSGEESVQSITGSKPKFTYVFDDEGEYYVRATVTDAAGETAEAESGILTVSSKLYVSIEADTAHARTGSAVTWTAQALNGTGSFRYTFELCDADDALLDRLENTEQNTYSHTFDAPGEYRVKVTVASGEETVEAESASVVVSQKMTLSVAADAETVKPDTDVRWTATAQNGVSPIRYCFKLYNAENELIKDCDETTSNTINSSLGPGEYYAQVVATDAEGDTAMAESGHVTVLPRLAVELTGGARWAYLGDTVVWTAEARNGTEPYRYQFQLYGSEGLIQSTDMGSARQYSYTFDELGNYSIHLDIMDADGQDAQTGSSENLTVVTPISLSVVGDKDSVSPNGTVTWTVTGTGGAGDYTFELYRGETPAEGETPFYTTTAWKHDYEFTFETVGAERVRVVMKDAGGMELCECTPAVSIESGLALWFTDSPLTAQPGNTFGWTVRADQGVEPVQYAFILKAAVDGSEDQLIDSTEYGDSASYSRVLTQPGIYTLTAMAKDAAGETAEAVSEPLKVKDDLTLSIRASATRVKPGDTVNWTVTGEGGITPYQYAFKVYCNGELIQSTESGKARSFSYTPDEPGEYYVLVKLTDADGDAFEAPSETLVVGASLAAEISADAVSARTGDTVTWTARGLSGAEPYRYAFTLLDAEGGALDSTDPGEANAYAHTFEAAGEYTVRVTVTDANSETATAESAALAVTVAPKLVFTESVKSVQTGGTAAWAVEGTDGVEPCLYAFQLMCDGEIVHETEFGAETRFEYTFNEPGEYIVQCMMRDAAGVTVQALSDVLRVGSITLTITASAQGAQTDDTVTWTAEGTGGAEPYQYGFSLYRDEELADTAAPGESGVYSFTFVKAGDYYVLAQLIDEEGQVVEARSETLSVLLANLEVLDIDDPASELSIIRAYTWTARAKGGEKPYEYRFVLKSGNETLYTRDFSPKQTFSYTFFDAGSYTLAVEVRDALGTQTDAYTESFDVATSDVTITGVVRIYVDFDPQTGKILENKTGHYELQINNSNGTEFAFGDRVYQNPVFSFHSLSGNGTPGVVSMFDGDRVLRPNSRLYTWTFNSTPDKLKLFMITNMEKLYLDTENRVETEAQVDYTIKSGPFQNYVITSSNCFTAVATWASWMGSDALKNEITSNYKDYIAPAMYKKLGNYWTYVGELRGA